MSRVYLGLGSNLGNREKNIRKALALINRLPFSRIAVVSSFYYNPAKDAAIYDFVNVVAEMYTYLHPIRLLICLKEIERRLGRKSKGDNLPRSIDIDILLYDDLVMEDKDLILPHPRMWSRDFVLVPLYEIAPELRELIKRKKGTSYASSENNIHIKKDYCKAKAEW